MTQQQPSVDTVSGAQKPLWLRPEWDGPRVEARPENADPLEWPAGSVERVTFQQADFKEFPCATRLPQTLHFGADGWPLLTPEQVKSRLDLRCQAELRRYPWVARPEMWDEGDWVRSFSNPGLLARLRRQAQIAHRLAPLLSSE